MGLICMHLIGKSIFKCPYHVTGYRMELGRNMLFRTTAHPKPGKTCSQTQPTNLILHRTHQTVCTILLQFEEQPPGPTNQPTGGSLQIHKKMNTHDTIKKSFRATNSPTTRKVKNIYPSGITIRREQHSGSRMTTN